MAWLRTNYSFLKDHIKPYEIKKYACSLKRINRVTIDSFSMDIEVIIQFLYQINDFIDIINPILNEDI